MQNNEKEIVLCSNNAFRNTYINPTVRCTVLYAEHEVPKQKGFAT